jgi:hypothetical protein
VQRDRVEGPKDERRTDQPAKYSARLASTTIQWTWPKIAKADRNPGVMLGRPTGRLGSQARIAHELGGLIADGEPS